MLVLVDFSLTAVFFLISFFKTRILFVKFVTFVVNSDFIPAVLILPWADFWLSGKFNITLKTRPVFAHSLTGFCVCNDAAFVYSAWLFIGSSLLITYVTSFSNILTSEYHVESRHIKLLLFQEILVIGKA